jgi:hypothetical protein
MQVHQHIIFGHQLLQRLDDVVKEIVHDVVVVFARAIGKVTGTEDDDCVVAAGLEIAAVRENSLVRLDDLFGNEEKGSGNSGGFNNSLSYQSPSSFHPAA